MENRFLGEMKTKNMSGPALCTWAFLSVCKHFKATEEWQEQHSEPPFAPLRSPALSVVSALCAGGTCDLFGSQVWIP